MFKKNKKKISRAFKGGEESGKKGIGVKFDQTETYNVRLKTLRNNLNARIWESILRKSFHAEFAL